MGILGVVGFAPRGLQKQALDFLAKKATAVMTNVPGPQQPLYMAGAQIKRMMFWVPQSGNIGMGVSILSYAGGVQFGLITDKRLCEEPQRIIDRFEPEFEKLVLALCMLPWNGPVDGDDAESWIFPRIECRVRRTGRATRRKRRARRRSARSGVAAVRAPAVRTKCADRSVRIRRGPDAKASAAGRASARPRVPAPTQVGVRCRSRHELGGITDT